MESIFVASSFQDPDKPLVDRVAAILGSFGLQPVNGRNTGGEQLESTIARKIEQTDGIVALFTQSDEGNGWSHPWVLGEFGHAVSKHKRAIAVVERPLDWRRTMWAGRQCIYLDRGEPLKALLALVDQIGVWRRETGLELTVILEQPEIVQEYQRNRDTERFKIKYRCWRRAQSEDWQECNRHCLEGAGLVAIMDKISSAEHLVEVEITCHGNRRWTTLHPVRQLVPVELIEDRP
jgi:hypothetical protein